MRKQFSGVLGESLIRMIMVHTTVSFILQGHIWKDIYPECIIG